LKRTAFNQARAFAYLILRERDLRNVRAVLRGKRLRINPDLIRQATGFITAEASL
jgi:V/A-type H+-transporting ATPase subunit C